MPHLIIGGTILLSVVLGIFGHFLGLGEIIHDLASENIPYYQSFVYNKRDVWSSPENGLISGKITGIRDGELELTDWNGGVWEIYTSGTVWNGLATNTLDKKIKIFGVKNDDGTFSAGEINDWKDKIRSTKK